MQDYDERIKRVCDFVQHHLDDDLNINTLCEVATLSRFHFHRMFCAYTGISLTRFIQLSRLKRASFQLAFEPSLKIIDIALQAGFDSPEAFSRAFKRTFCQTPGTFRKMPDWYNWHRQFEFSIPRGVNSMNVQVVERKAEKVARLTHTGTPDRIMESAGRFIEWRKQSGLSPIKSSNTYGIPNADPNTVAVEDFRFDICGSIAKDVPENSYGVHTYTIPAGRCAVLRHSGSHDNIEDSVYQLIREWLPQSGEEHRDYPVMFHYLNFVHEVDECDLQTDIYFPLK